MGTSVSSAFMARIRTFAVACATFALTLGLAPATSLAADAPMLASSLLDGSTAIVSEDVELVAVDDDGVDAVIEPVIGSFTVDGLTFAVGEDGVSLVSVEPSVILSAASAAGGVEGSLSVPQTITYAGVTYDVAAIGPYAFYLSGATQVELPASIALVDDRAFRSSDVAWVEVVPDNPNIASFDGCLYDSQLTSLLLIPEGRAGAVLLPRQAEVASPSKFSHCSLVDAISVEEGGAAFASWDGLLYSSDGTTLLRVPAGATEITIREGCTTIAAGAMEGCAKLERIDAPSTVSSISPNVFESVPTISLPVASVADDSAGVEGEAEVSPRRVVASSQGLEAPLALPDLGSTSASPSTEAPDVAGGQLSALIALSTADGDEPIIDAQKITVGVADSNDASCWEDLHFSVHVLGAVPEAILQAVATNGAATYTMTVHPNGHELSYTYFVRNVKSDQGKVSSPCTYTWGNRFHTGTSYFDILAAESGTYIGFSGGTPGWRVIGFSTYPGGPLFAEGTLRYESVTAYANWLPNTYTIAFNSQGGGAVGDVGATYDEDATLPTPVRAGFAFQGWDTEEDGTGTRYQAGSVRNLTTKHNDTITLYAQWETLVIDFDVDSEPNDGAYPGEEKPSIEAGSAVQPDGAIPIEDPKRPGYVFQGWVIPDVDAGNKEALDQDLVYQGDDGKWYVDASKLPDYATDGKVELTARWTSIISVDVPSAVTFYADVVTQGNESREGAVSSAFGQSKVANQSQVDLRVVSLESSAVETTDTMLGADSILKKSTTATPASSAQKLLSLYPSTKAWTAEELQDPLAVGGDKATTAVDFDLDDILLEASFNAEDYTIPAGDTLNMGYRLNLTETGQELDYDKLSTLADGQSASIANVSYCFAADGSRIRPSGSKSDPLYVELSMEDAEVFGTQYVSPGVYGLADIKAAAEDLSMHSGDPAQSDYYALYKGLLDRQVTNVGEPGEGPYFQLKVAGAVSGYLDLQLIGICQDFKADGTGKAGLTFQLRDAYARSGKASTAAGGRSFVTYMNATDTQSGGWVSSALRKALNGTFKDLLDPSVQSSIVSVLKAQQLGASGLQSSTEVIWLPSVYEVLGITSAGNNDNEKSSKGGYVPFRYLAFLGSSNETGNAQTRKAFNGECYGWWTRSGATGNASFLNINNSGGLSRHPASSTTYGIVPCFCL